MTACRSSVILLFNLLLMGATTRDYFAVIARSGAIMCTFDDMCWPPSYPTTPLLFIYRIVKLPSILRYSRKTRYTLNISNKISNNDLIMIFFRIDYSFNNYFAGGNINDSKRKPNLRNFWKTKFAYLYEIFDNVWIKCFSVLLFLLSTQWSIFDA